MCMCAQQNTLSVMLALRKERAISNGKTERALITIVIYIVSSVYKGLSHAPLYLILTTALWEVILSHLCFIWEKLKIREVRYLA